jgi:ELP3 family radical SAM enzyme/protein acetyltransferase
MVGDIEDLMRKIHNPALIKQHINIDADFPTLKSYVNDLINFFDENSNASDREHKLYMNKLDKKYKFKRRPKQSNLITIVRKKYYDNEIECNKLIFLVEKLRAKNSRSLSGILEVAIMTKPGEFSCEFDCYYCPNQKDMPRSYVKEEPAVRRGAQNNFDTVLQTFDRIGQYVANGHYGDKGEFIILGGTWSNYSYEYQREFMRDLYYACNIFFDRERKERYSLEEEKRINETALFKVVGLTVETRPDMITVDEIKRYIEYGVTRVQLGIQTTHDKLLKKINRKCYSIDTKRALYLLKNAGFKILCHFMPNLPGSTPEMDIKMFDTIIDDPAYDCDEWKIYPTSVTTTSEKDIEQVDTVIEKWFLEGKYIPYDTETLKTVLKYAKSRVQSHKRISRIFRDIPIDNIIGGADVPHLRQVLQKEMHDEGKYCKCIRCREIKNNEFKMSDVFYKVETYEASAGTEYFITANVNNINKPHLPWLIGFCRLRIRKHEWVSTSYNQGFEKTNFINILDGASLVREMHVYGRMVPSYLSKFEKSNSQHRGIGSKLLKMAEDITIENGLCKVAVISGVGVRGFYDKNGYYLVDNYMVKKLDFDRCLDYYTEKYINRNTIIYYIMFFLVFYIWKNIKKIDMYYYDNVNICDVPLLNDFNDY